MRGGIFAVFVLSLIAAVIFFFYILPPADVLLGPIVTPEDGALRAEATELFPDSPPDGNCCLCISDRALPFSSEYCEQFLSNPANNCAVKRHIPIDSSSDTCWQDINCATAGLDCGNRPLLVRKNVHSNSNRCFSLLDFSVKVCVEANAACVDVVDTGCRTFENTFLAFVYANYLKHRYPGLRLKVTANTCVSWAHPDACTADQSLTGCTLDFEATGCVDVRYALCNFGESCGGDCSSAFCTDIDGRVVKKQCCDSGSSRNKWVREGECNSCEGACCLLRPDSLILPGGGLCWDTNDNPPIGVPPGELGCENQFMNTFHTPGVWHQGVSCSQISCPTNLGACCGIRFDGTTDCNDFMTEEACIAERRYSFYHTTLWHQGKSCEDVNSCVGSCCIHSQEDAGEVTTCQDDVSEWWCGDIRSVPSVISTDFNPFLSCDARKRWGNSCANQGAPKGACCLELDGPGRLKQCFNNINRTECERLAQNPLVLRHRWGFKQTCKDFCPGSEGCRERHPDWFAMQTTSCPACIDACRAAGRCPGWGGICEGNPFTGGPDQYGFMCCGQV